MTQVCFSHGKESGPWGTKITALAAVARDRNLDVVSIDYRGIEDPHERVRRLRAHCDGLSAPPILVGSSMGAYVSLAAAAHCAARAMFLMAPAVYVPGYDQFPPPQPSCPVTIVHGWRDEIIPPANVFRFAGECRARLYVLDADHRLRDKEPELRRLFDWFIADHGESS